MDLVRELHLLLLLRWLQVVFRDPVRYKLQKVLTVAAEGTYSGQVGTRRQLLQNLHMQQQRLNKSCCACQQAAGW